MQNDVLKNEIAPWQEKGRWYHGVADVVTKTFDANKTDQFLIDNAELVVQSSCLVIGPKGASGSKNVKNEFIDAKSINNSLANTMGSGVSLIKGFYDKKGATYLTLGPSSAVTGGIIEFWVFVAKYDIN